MLREPRALWLFLIATSAVYAVFASVVSVGYTAIYGLSRWTLKPDTPAIFPFLVLMNLVTWVGYAMWIPAIFWLGRRFRFDRQGWWRALLVHGPASLVITSVHLAFVGITRWFLQGSRRRSGTGDHDSRCLFPHRRSDAAGLLGDHRTAARR